MTDHKTINDLVAHEWRPGVSAGAAARQICRSLGPSALKELLEALLTEANEASHDRYLILDEIKKFNLDFGKQVELARDQASFKDQSETTQARWLGYAEVALAFRSPSVNGAVAMDRDQIALDAAHQIEALPNDLGEIQKTARIQLIVLSAIRAAAALHSRNDRSASEQAHEADFIDREALLTAGPQGPEPGPNWARFSLVNMMSAVSKLSPESTEQELFGRIADALLKSNLRLPSTGDSPALAGAPAGALREALTKVRMELWVDYCLGMGRTDTDPRPFDSKPHIRIIDAALSAREG